MLQLHNVGTTMRGSVCALCVALSVSACASLPGALPRPIASTATGSVPQPATPPAQVEPFRQQPRNIPAPALPFQLSRQILPKPVPTSQPPSNGLDRARAALPTAADLVCVNALRAYKASLGNDPFGQPSGLREAMLEACSAQPASVLRPSGTGLPRPTPPLVQPMPVTIGAGPSLF
jgi:hypothetical protein